MEELLLLPSLTRLSEELRVFSLGGAIAAAVVDAGGGFGFFLANGF